MMKKLLLIVSLLGGTSLYGSLQPVEFVLLVTSYNNERYVYRNLDSIFCQKTTVPFQTIYVDDCSTDRTGTLVREYATMHNLDESQLKIITNTLNIGSGLANIYTTVHDHIADHKVVVCVDGDDFLSFSGVLKRLEQEYADPSVWMTYGRFIVIPSGEFWAACWGYPHEIIQSRSFRSHHNVPSHIKTFRAKLFKKIHKKDLLDNQGSFYSKAWDMAMMFPMLEMCAPLTPKGSNHSRFIEDTVLYIYNYDNPISDGKSDEGRKEQIRLDRNIRLKKPYEPLESLFKEDL